MAPVVISVKSKKLAHVKIYMKDRKSSQTHVQIYGDARISMHNEMNKLNKAMECIDLTGDCDSEEEEEEDSDDLYEDENESDKENQPPYASSITIPHPFKASIPEARAIETPITNKTASRLYVPSYFDQPLLIGSERSPFRTPLMTCRLDKKRGRPRKVPFGPKRKVGRPKAVIDDSIFEMTPPEEA